MAVIEIRAATLPGFPYYFPYRTGVRLFNTVEALGGKVFTGDAEASITAEATVTSLRTANVDADLGTEATITSDHLVAYVAAAELEIVSVLQVDSIRDATIQADLTVIASTDTFASRHQDIDAELAFSAVADEVLKLDAYSPALDPLIEVGDEAAASLQAVASAELPLFSDTDTDQYQDSVSSSDTTLTADQSAVMSRHQDLDTDLAFAASISADAPLSGVTFAETVIDITTDQALLRTQYIAADLEITAAPDARVTNADVRFTVTATGEADTMRTQYAEALLEITADTLVDCLDTRYGQVTLAETAGAEALLNLLAQSETEQTATADFTADSMRTQYAEAQLSVVATATADDSHAQFLTAALAVTTGITADSHVERYGQATTTVAASINAEVQRETYGMAELTVTAEPTDSVHRETYANAELDVSTTLDRTMQLYAPISAIPYEIMAESEAMHYVAYVGQTYLNLWNNTEAHVSADFVVAGPLRLSVEQEDDSRVERYAVAELVLQTELGTTALRTVRVTADLGLVAQAEASTRKTIHILASLLLEASLPASMLYRHAGGNPMWLMFFYAGHGEE